MADNSHGGLEARVFPGTFIAYRTWAIRPAKMQLEAINGTLWPLTGKLKADCDRNFVLTKNSHEGVEAPASGCTCGIYCRYDPYDLPSNSASILGLMRTVVAGAVALSGLIDHGDRGARAQYAQPLAITHFGIARRLGTGQTTHQIAKETAKAHRIPYIENMDDLVVAFPPEDVSEFKALGEKQRVEELERFRKLYEVQIVTSGDLTFTAEPAEKIMNMMTAPNSSGNVSFNIPVGDAKWIYELFQDVRRNICPCGAPGCHHKNKNM